MRITVCRSRQSFPTIAVIGPEAATLDALDVNSDGTHSAPVTVLSGLRKRFPQSKIRYVQGTGLIGTVVSPVPTTALYTSPARTKHGLKAEYFDNVQLEGAPVMRRTDADVNFV